MQKRNCREIASALRACLLAAVISSSALAQVTFKTLVDFNVSNGQEPGGAPVQGLDGNFYGTTGGGGTNSSGTAFKMSPSGTLTTLYNFCSKANCADGAGPVAALVLGTDGNFYGTTTGGGTANLGTVFKLTPPGGLATLYSFCSQASCADGEVPLASLLLAADGNFYGTTLLGGSFPSFGTIFKITPGGRLTTLYSFSGQADGGCPEGGLVQNSNGTFYGTGSCGGNEGGGTIFTVTPEGSFQTLYGFAGGAAGSTPLNGLAQASNGNFYGTTYSGGDYGQGTIFEITPWGSLTTLYMFTGASDGSEPSGLWLGTDGKVYGTTQAGGTFNDQCGSSGGCGTVFKITAQGSLTTLHDFCSLNNCADGNYPRAGLVQGTDGKFYGSTLEGGSGRAGTLFRVTNGLGSFIETLPTAGRVGQVVTILGTGLVGVTEVTFNGISATFTPVSATAIKATVPTGATTGPVQVVTPSGTLTGNVNFRVEP